MEITSVIIPARNDPYLQRTIDDLLVKAKGAVEVIVMLDGYWPDPPVRDFPNVTLVHFSETEGMRQAINAGARIAKGKYLMKCDAHCSFDEGFDIKLIENCEYDWTVVPVRYRLNVKLWEREDKSYEFQYIRQTDLKGKDWHEYADRVVGQTIVDLMTSQGSCWFMHRERFWELGGLDEVNYGAMGKEAQEVCLKTWLSGGRYVLNRNTWYAHWAKDTGLYRDVRGEKRKSAEFALKFWSGNSHGYKHSLQWLVDKFAPVPSWENTMVKDINKQAEQKQAPEIPFMSFVTRCYKRPKALQKCIDSINAQTDKDFEHIFIVDDIGRGIGWANKQFYVNRSKVKGRYVYLVDDDSVIIDKDFVASVKELVSASHVDVVMVKKLIKNVIYPKKDVWETHIPVGGRIACGNICVSNEVFQKHIKSFGRQNAGDFFFIKAVLDEKYKVHWLERIVMDTERHWGMAEGENNLRFIFRKRGSISRKAISPIKVRKDRRRYLYSLFNELGFKYGAEIGVKRGINALAICKHIPGLSLKLVDPYISYGEDEVEISDVNHNSFYNHAKKILKPYDVQFIVKKSMDAIKEVEPESLDFVYIDGNHTFDYVMQDLIEWSKKVRIGGIISGHDYFNWVSTRGAVGGVVDAVNIYVRVHGIKDLFVTDESSPSFFWVKK